MPDENTILQIPNSNNTCFEQNKENLQKINDAMECQKMVTGNSSQEQTNNPSDLAISIDTKLVILQNNEETKPLQPNKIQANRIICEETEFYKKAQDYWSNVPATVNGMLGGLGYISAIDIQGSVSFLRELRIPENKFALDCGAGIGRVTKNLLMPRFECVDMVEQDEKFTKTAESYCTSDAGSTLGFPKRLGEIYNIGLQEFVPTEEKYNLIWSQWVLGHLTDDDLLAFFRRIKIGLKTNGGSYFVMKENVTSGNKTAIKDDTDSSVTRPLRDYENFLRKAGLKIVKTTRQQSFPKGLYPVFMIACRVKN